MEEDCSSLAIGLRGVSAALAQQAVMARTQTVQPLETGRWLPFREACDYRATPQRPCERDTMSILQTEILQSTHEPGTQIGVQGRHVYLK